MFATRGILRGLRSHLLQCGCLAGIYERYGGETIVIIDAAGEGCGEAGHMPGLFVPLESVPIARASRSDVKQRAMS